MAKEVIRKLEEFTRNESYEDMEELINEIKTKYTPDQLKDFMSKAFTEKLLLTISMELEDNKPDMNLRRKEMIKTLEELQTIASETLNKKLKEVM